MATALYHCPCCNKLVPATHFRRAPWTEQDLSELLSHPRLQKLVRAMVKECLPQASMEAARQLVLEAIQQKHAQFIKQVRQENLRVVPPGYLLYEQACQRFNISYMSLRSYVSQKRIVGGKGVVSELSMEEFMRTYKPRHKTRRS